MTQENTDKRIVKKKHFILAVFMFVMLGGIFSVFAALAPGGAENRNEAAEKLLFLAQSASTSVEEVVRLIQEGADVNATDKEGQTPLIRSASFFYDPQPQNVRILIENDADVVIKDKKDKNAFDYVGENRKLNRKDIYDLLRERTLSQME